MDHQVSAASLLDTPGLTAARRRAGPDGDLDSIALQEAGRGLADVRGYGGFMAELGNSFAERAAAAELQVTLSAYAPPPELEIRSAVDGLLSMSVDKAPKVGKKTCDHFEKLGITDLGQLLERILEKGADAIAAPVPRVSGKLLVSIFSWALTKAPAAELATGLGTELEKIYEIVGKPEPEPGQETAEAEPGQEAAEAEPGQEVAEAEPGQETAEAEPGQEAAEAEPGQEVAEAEPVATEPEAEPVAGVEPAEAAEVGQGVAAPTIAVVEPEYDPDLEPEPGSTCARCDGSGFEPCGCQQCLTGKGCDNEDACEDCGGVGFNPEPELEPVAAEPEPVACGFCGRDAKGGLQSVHFELICTLCWGAHDGICQTAPLDEYRSALWEAEIAGVRASIPQDEDQWGHVCGPLCVVPEGHESKPKDAEPEPVAAELEIPLSVVPDGLTPDAVAQALMAQEWCCGSCGVLYASLPNPSAGTLAEAMRCKCGEFVSSNLWLQVQHLSAELDKFKARAQAQALSEAKADRVSATVSILVDIMPSIGTTGTLISLDSLVRTAVREGVASKLSIGEVTKAAGVVLEQMLSEQQGCISVIVDSRSPYAQSFLARVILTAGSVLYGSR